MYCGVVVKSKLGAMVGKGLGSWVLECVGYSISRGEVFLWIRFGSKVWEQEWGCELCGFEVEWFKYCN